MKIAVIGSGGREHAIVWKIAQSPLAKQIWAVPGNGGTSLHAKNVDANPSDVRGIADLCSNLRADLVVVGPEMPLSLGLADELTKRGLPCFGPHAAAARIESSKAFAKQLMRRTGVPTADFEVFDEFESFKRYVQTNSDSGSWVVKADGLAAGKGAFVCSTEDEVLSAAYGLLVDRGLGDAGGNVVLERKLSGVEASCMYWCAGTTYAPLPVAQDFKRAYDGDQGPNTGGMGSLCPATTVNEQIQREIGEQIIAPVLVQMEKEGFPYCGLLYAGLMFTAEGPQVIEFNCRFGDPETQVILPVWGGDFVETAMACATGRLDPIAHAISASGHAVCTALVAEGYPGAYSKGTELHEAECTDGQLLFHAGTERSGNRLLSTGGRVLNAVGLGLTRAMACERAYELTRRLAVPGLRYRTDIARES